MGGRDFPLKDPAMVSQSFVRQDESRERKSELGSSEAVLRVSLPTVNYSAIYQLCNCGIDICQTLFVVAINTKILHILAKSPRIGKVLI